MGWKIILYRQVVYPFWSSVLRFGYPSAKEGTQALGQFDVKKDCKNKITWLERGWVRGDMTERCKAISDVDKVFWALIFNIFLWFGNKRAHRMKWKQQYLKPVKKPFFFTIHIIMLGKAPLKDIIEGKNLAELKKKRLDIHKGNSDHPQLHRKKYRKQHWKPRHY